jgi:hypothetical protein
MRCGLSVSEMNDDESQELRLVWVVEMAQCGTLMIAVESAGTRERKVIRVSCDGQNQEVAI